MITEKNYNNISKKVYDLDPVKYPELEKQLKADDAFLSGGQRFVVLDAEGNSLNPTENGMQAMAVAPYVNGKADTSQIVIAYAGTNIMDAKEGFRNEAFFSLRKYQETTYDTTEIVYNRGKEGSYDT